MKRALTYVTFLDLIFIILLSFSGLASGIIGELMYYFAFLVPILIAFCLKRSTGADFCPPKLKISRENIILTLPTAPPVLATVFVISWLTSLLLSFIGEGSVPDVSGNLVKIILTNALLTAILEEALFRYIPLAFITPYTKRGAVIFSAMFFALAHCNLYQLPYAFFAGVVFAVLDIAFDSVIPSVVIHFLNNLISIFWIRGSDNMSFVIVYMAILFGTALLSFIPIIIFRGRYKDKITECFLDKRPIEISYTPILFAAMTLLIAITEVL